MIEVQALKEKGHYKSFHIQGHAGYADAGEDTGSEPPTPPSGRFSTLASGKNGDSSGLANSSSDDFAVAFFTAECAFEVETASALLPPCPYPCLCPWL